MAPLCLVDAQEVAERQRHTNSSEEDGSRTGMFVEGRQGSQQRPAGLDLGPSRGTGLVLRAAGSHHV